MRIAVSILLVLPLLAACENAAQSPASELTSQSGSLAGYLKAVEFGQADMDDWREPSAATMSSFGDALSTLLAGDTDTAASLAGSVGYSLIRYEDTDYSPSRIHYLLAETSPFGHSGFTGGGTYAYYPDGADLAVEAPHPVFDSNTGDQAIDQYLTVQAKFLILSGVHRHTSPNPTTCSGTTNYRISDPAHYHNNLFNKVHQVVDGLFPSLVFLQLHGFGTTSLAALQADTGVTSDAAVIISQGTGQDWTTAEQSFAARLATAIAAEGTITPVTYPHEYGSLGGTQNVPGRFTNGSAQPCLTAATNHSGRFVHLEQSSTVRQQHQAIVAQAVLTALP